MPVFLLHSVYQRNKIARSLQKGFSALPGSYLFTNLKNVANDGTFPMFRGILNSLIVSGCSAAIATYFSALTAYGLYAYDFKLKKAAFTFIMAILVMPTQVTADGISQTDHEYGNV